MVRAETLILLVGVLAAPFASAQEERVQLKDGQGREVVESNCATCHSLDYIQINSPFLDRKGWEKSVDKMVQAMGAPINDEDASKIVDYLAAQYGKPPKP